VLCNPTGMHRALFQQDRSHALLTVLANIQQNSMFLFLAQACYDASPMLQNTCVTCSCESSHQHVTETVDRNIPMSLNTNEGTCVLCCRISSCHLPPPLRLPRLHHLMSMTQHPTLTSLPPTADTQLQEPSPAWRMSKQRQRTGTAFGLRG
jgi:hypothetical protein